MQKLNVSKTYKTKTTGPMFGKFNSSDVKLKKQVAWAMMMLRCFDHDEGFCLQRMTRNLESVECARFLSAKEDQEP